MILSMVRNEKGIALISVYMVAAFITAVSAAAYSKSFFEMRQVEREVNRVKAFAAAEAGVQNALAQIGANAYTGFINTATITVTNFQATNGKTVGNYSVAMSYPNQADWVIVQATATVDNETRMLEGRVFLDSNLSKYLVYANTSSFGSGSNAQYGDPDITDANGDGVPDYPEKVPSDEDDRAALYYTGDWNASGPNVQLYGDTHAQGKITGDSSSQVHGDTYASTFATNTSGSVTNSGVIGTLKVDDGFKDDVDRNKDGTVNTPDYPDYHGLTASGGNGDHQKESLVQIDHNFYKTNNSVATFAGTTAKNRFLEFQSNSTGTSTQIVEYSDATFAPTKQVTTYSLPPNAIVYVNGDIYAKGEIGGRVSVVSSDDIFFDGNVSYSNGQTKADPNHSTAFLAKDKLYFRPDTLSVSGILYAENSGSTTATAFDASYNASGQVTSSKTQLRLYGNRVMNGDTNMSIYLDRVYGYDKNLKYYRPPGIPVYPDLRIVREEAPTTTVS